MPASNPGLMKALNNPVRLKALHSTRLLDTPYEQTFDRITDLVRRLLNVPIALISLVENNRQFFKSQYGLPSAVAEMRQTPLSHSFCKFVVQNRGGLSIDDAATHRLTRDNNAVHDLGVKAYLGSPLWSDGQVIGSLCAIDNKSPAMDGRRLACAGRHGASDNAGN